MEIEKIEIQRAAVPVELDNDDIELLRFIKERCGTVYATRVLRLMVPKAKLKPVYNIIKEL